VFTHDVLQQLVRDRREQREAEAQAERIELPARTPKLRRTARLALGPFARVRRQRAHV
jgi:hypothetical protein